MHNNKPDGDSNSPIFNWRIATLCIFLAAFLALFRGQDANWDLQNYHYYNPYAWVNDRAAIDIAPAQLQSFHSPYADLPYYYMAKADVPSWLSSIVLAIPMMIALFLLSLIAQQMLLASQRANHPMLKHNFTVACIVLIAATGSAGGPTAGTTMSEWHLVALFLGGFLLLLVPFTHENAASKLSLVSVLLAGLLGGFAVGLKLTAGPYAIGLAVFLMALPASITARIQRVAVLAMGGIVGAFVAYGPWGYELWTRYQNPFFPYFNDIFLSPWIEPLRFSDARFLANDAWKFFATPWLIMKETTGFVIEMPFRDWRMGLGLPALVWLAWKTPATNARRLWRAVLLMTLTTYGLWALLFGYYRYASLLELISVIAIFSAVVSGLAKINSVYRKNLILLATVLLLLGTTRWPLWARTEHGEMAVIAALPLIPNNSMVIVATLEPVGYLTTSLPASVPVVAIVNNIMRPAEGVEFELHKQAMHRLVSHQGQVFALVRNTVDEERYYSGQIISEMVALSGFRIEKDECRLIIGKINQSKISLCPVKKI